MGWVVDVIQQPFYLKDRAVVPVVLDDKQASGPVWTSVGKENLFASLNFKPQTIQPIVSPYTSTNYNDRHHIKHIILAHCVIPGRSLNPISPLPKYPNRGVLGKCLLNAADSTFHFPW